ncbi:hypothetical protein TNCV_1734851 [Trichonephila clavipes]|nr:hypothetical protein TNCV_1734851 [Trichonephila clavipes]
MKAAHETHGDHGLPISVITHTTSPTSEPNQLKAIGDGPHDSELQSNDTDCTPQGTLLSKLPQHATIVTTSSLDSLYLHHGRSPDIAPGCRSLFRNHDPRCHFDLI